MVPRLVCALLMVASTTLFAQEEKPEKWPPEVKDITFVSSADQSQQPTMWYKSPQEEPRPLLVALHTWSGDYRQKTGIPYAEWCIKKDWHFLHPNFRGRNRTPEAMGSELVVADILDAVAFAEKSAKVDKDRIFLVGVSGGGYATLLMAGRAPEKWAGASAWVGITDLKAWYSQTKKAGLRYADEIVAAAGGIPDEDPNAEEECKRRSALTYLPQLKKKPFPVSINVGIHDGHSGSVPVSQSMIGFNAIATRKDRFSKREIKYVTEKEELPDSLSKDAPTEPDPHFGSKPVLLHRKSGSFEINIFDGGHEIIYEAALSWLENLARQ